MANKSNTNNNTTYNNANGDIINQEGNFNIGVDKSTNKQQVSNSTIQYNTTLNPGYDQILEETRRIVAILRQQYPQATQQEASTIIGSTIKRDFPDQWQKLLNIRRLWNGVKKSAIKLGEHYVEETPWGKAVVGFLEGVTDEAER